MNGAVCSFGRYTAGKTYKITAFNPAAYVHWEPEIQRFGAVYSSNSGFDASQYPNETEGIGHRHKKGAVITDRKSTRLNSSHSQISYAVFCLKIKYITST